MNRHGMTLAALAGLIGALPETSKRRSFLGKRREELSRSPERAATPSEIRELKVLTKVVPLRIQRCDERRERRMKRRATFAMRESKGGAE